MSTLDIPVEQERIPFDRDVLREMWETSGLSGYSYYSMQEFRATVDATFIDLVDFDWCSHCHEVDVSEDLITVQGGDVACESCVEDNYYGCDSCSELASSTTHTGDGDSVCDPCLNDYSYCEDCEEYYAESHNHFGCMCEARHQQFTVRNDGDPPLANDQRATVTLPAGTIDAVGLDRIAAYLRGEGLYGAMYEVYAIGDAWQTRDGNFTKRLSRAAYKRDGTKISSDVLSQVGCIARDHSKTVDHKIEVTRNLNLPAADFYHEDSCWWGGYSESRCALKSNGGIGLRTFNDQHGEVSGRAWILPVNHGERGFTPTADAMTADAFIVFNGYGDLSGYTPARIWGHMQGMTYRKVDFGASPMYVNNDTGYLVAPEEIAAQFTDGSIYMDVDEH